MEFIKCDRDGELLIVTMDRGKANALNPPMIEELIGAIQQGADSGDVRGVVLASDKPKFFSSGFDVGEVFQFEREKMGQFFGRFIQCRQNMFNLPKPLIAAVGGHAFAGGAVLALACYGRVMAAGDFGFALNEVNLGVVVPAWFIQLAAHAVGTRNARGLVVEGKTISPTQALAIGLADEVAPPEMLLERAKARVRELAAKPPQAFSAAKKVFEETTGKHSMCDDSRWLDQFLDHWFSPEAMRCKQALTESMRR